RTSEREGIVSLVDRPTSESLQLTNSDADTVHDSPFLVAPQAHVPGPVPLWRGKVGHEAAAGVRRRATAVPKRMCALKNDFGVSLKVLPAALPHMKLLTASCWSAAFYKPTLGHHARRIERRQCQFLLTNAKRTKRFA